MAHLMWQLLGSTLLKSFLSCNKAKKNVTFLQCKVLFYGDFAIIVHQKVFYSLYIGFLKPVIWFCSFMAIPVVDFSRDRYKIRKAYGLK